MTDFPPPEGFTGYESRPYDDVDDDERYVRVCTEEEIAVLEADAKRARDAERTEKEDLRDIWFALLREDVNRDRHAELVSASIPETGGEHVEMDPGIEDDC